MRRAPAAAALIALALVSFALADRETAQFAAGRGDKALAAKKFDEAEALFRKALEEDATYLPARFGVAQALVGAAKSAQAIEELRRFVDEARALSPLPPEWKPTLAKAERQLADLDANGTALQKILDGHAAALVDLAQRWMAKDAAVAERALRRALELKPGLQRAVDLLDKMGKSAASETLHLFNGTDLTGWEFAHAPTWQVVGGELVCDGRDIAVSIRSQPTFDGNYDVRMDAKVLNDYPGLVLYNLLPSWKGDYDHYDLGVEKETLQWIEQAGEGKKRSIAATPAKSVIKDFDRKAWHTFEMRIRANEVTALVDGQVIGKEPRPATRAGGFVGILVQNAKVAFRNVQVDRR